MCRVVRAFVLPAFVLLVTLFQIVNAQTPCRDNCRAVDKVFENYCSTVQRNEICHGTRTAWINRCFVQCAFLEGDLPPADLARAGCQIQCNTVVNQVFTTYCVNNYPLETRFTCYDQLNAYAEVCKNQCTLL